MVIYRFTPESDEENSSKNEKQGKMPDFIYVDRDDQLQNEQRESGNRETPFFKTIGNKTSYPFFLRFLTLLGGVILTVLAAVAIGLFLIFTVMSIVSFFQLPSTIQMMSKTWKLIGNYSAYALALYVATLNPAFGFGIFALYALQNGENVSQKMPFGKIFKGHFD